MYSPQDEFLMMALTALSQFPMLILLAVGVILALKNMSTHPKVSKLALIGFITLILQIIFFTFATAMLPRFLSQNGSSNYEIRIYFSILGIVRAILSTASWGFVVAAVFVQRYGK